MTNSNKASLEIRFWFIIIPVVFLLAYLYWWLTCPCDERVSSGEMETPSPTKGPLVTKVDDFTKIKGIGPKTAELFRSQSILTYSQLALMAEKDLRELLKTARMYMADPSTWSEQARLAAL